VTAGCGGGQAAAPKESKCVDRWNAGTLDRSEIRPYVANTSVRVAVGFWTSMYPDMCLIEVSMPDLNISLDFIAFVDPHKQGFTSGTLSNRADLDPDLHGWNADALPDGSIKLH
jgi:hypothetical protein